MWLVEVAEVAGVVGVWKVAAREGVCECVCGARVGVAKAVDEALEASRV